MILAAGLGIGNWGIGKWPMTIWFANDFVFKF